ncbi:hypothetical protein ACSBR2_039648 [Camellia fascicularis]
MLKGNEVVLPRILTIFTTIDLSHNKFRGEIPNAIGKLYGLRLFNLSHNNLIGNIPSSLGNLCLLESLDLSSNQLSGKIPSQLTSLTFLCMLNFSQNHLEGRIPRGNQFETFEIVHTMGTWHYVDFHCRRNVEILTHHNCIQHLCCTRKMIQLLQVNLIGKKTTEEREKITRVVTQWKCVSDFLTTLPTQYSAGECWQNRWRLNNLQQKEETPAVVRPPGDSPTIKSITKYLSKIINGAKLTILNINCDSSIDRDKLPKSFILIQVESPHHSNTLVPYPLISDSDIFGDNLGLAEIISASRSGHVAPRLTRQHHLGHVLFS